MWEDLGEGSELVLGIAIALHTLYQFATHYFEQQRQRQALIRTLHAELSYFLSLAGSLAGRASQAVEALRAHLDAQGFPDPAKEADSMPESALPLAAWLVDRAERLAAYRFSVDVEQIGSMLNRRQIDALMNFLDAHRRYVEILMTRALDLKAFPRKRGVLRRFAGVVLLNIDSLKREFAILAVLLKLEKPTEQVA